MENNKEDQIVVWVVLWLLMFAQVTIIPMPAMPIYAFCINTTLVSFRTDVWGLFSVRTLFFTIFVTSASVMGAIVAYWMGRLGGKKAGKWIYAATVLLPIFPDDIICIVVGSMKMDFKFYSIVNFTGRIIGTYCMLLFMRMPGVNKFFSSAVDGGFPWALLIYSLLLLSSLVAAIFWKRKVLSRSCIDNGENI